MRRYYTKANQPALLQEVASWIGTPFHDHAGIKGAGVDCVHLALRIYQATGFLPEGLVFPDYTLDGGHHQTESKVIAFVEGLGRFAAQSVKPATADWCPGDLLGFTIGKVVHHVGVAVDNLRFVHVLQSNRVAFSSVLDSTWIKRLACKYRPQQA